MKENFFYKEVNKQSRKEMAFYIKNHFTYSRLNSWNNWQGYANNVKIYNLGLTKEQEKKAYNIILDYEIDAIEFWDTVRDYIYYFKEATGYETYFNDLASYGLDEEDEEESERFLEEVEEFELLYSQLKNIPDELPQKSSILEDYEMVLETINNI